MTNSEFQKSDWCDICTVRFRKKFINVCALECTDISFVPEVGLEVFLVPPKIDVPRKLHIGKVGEFSGSLSVSFQEALTCDVLRELDGMHLIVSEANACSLKQPENLRFVGWSVKNSKTGDILEIDDVIEMPTQLLAISHTGGRETQIVLHDDLIVDIDDDKQLITLVMPDSFI